MVVAFPSVLPILKGMVFEEGPINDMAIAEDFVMVHELFDDMIHLQMKSFQLTDVYFQ